MSALGNSGTSLGIAGLSDAIALVLDTNDGTTANIAPYLATWITDSTGQKTVGSTYTTGLTTTGYKTLTYSFDYSAATRTITYQVYLDGTALLGDSGYQVTVPDDQTEYSFLIAAATSSTAYNYQYASVLTAHLPVLTTNTPTVTNAT